MAERDDLIILEEILGQSGEEVPTEILDLEAFLSQSPLFATLAPEDREALAKKARYKWVTGGERIIAEGTRGDTFAIVKSGRVVVEATFEGERRRLATLGPGAVVGEVAVLKGTPRTADVIAEGDVELFEFHRDDIQPYLEKYPELRERLEELIEARSESTIAVFLGKEPE